MHMADALVSPTVAAGATLISVAALVVAAKKVKQTSSDAITPLMGVVGAFIFAAQMINFTIPGTGSSGHIIGGILAAALLGPWAGLITIASVLVVQCLIFADGGLMALGCNILNMGVCTTLIGYLFLYRPIAGKSLSLGRIMTASIIACVVGLELGAIFVTAETELSGVTALPWKQFFTLMTSIHLAIGAGEGIATGLLLYYVAKMRPELLLHAETGQAVNRPSKSLKPILYTLGALAVVFACSFMWIASSNPDGLEWSISKITGTTELIGQSAIQTREAFAHAQNMTSVLPDYENTWSGIIGCTLVVIITWCLLSCLRLRHAVSKVK